MSNADAWADIGAFVKDGDRSGTFADPYDADDERNYLVDDNEAGDSFLEEPLDSVDAEWNGTQCQECGSLEAADVGGGEELCQDCAMSRFE